MSKIYIATISAVIVFNSRVGLYAESDIAFTFTTERDFETFKRSSKMREAMVTDWAKPRTKHDIEYVILNHIRYYESELK